MNILIAEDQQVARLVLMTHLSNWGHKVIEVADGVEALNYMTAGGGMDVDMLITDWSMPHMDGLELAHRVRSLTARSRYIYIMLLTGRGDLDDRIQGFTEGGVDDYIVKPFEVVELMQRIRVADRIVASERKLRAYNQDLESLVRWQTEAIRRTQGEIVSRLFNALEVRDQETGGHVQRIGYISSRLGRLLGWDENAVNTISAAAPLHDIGKIGVTDEVLKKPGRLTPEEFKIIQEHTIIGARILAGSQDFVINTAEYLALRHHENWDGSGYPGGLSGEGIPVEARVVAIVDVYDALMADRIYRKGLPEPEVLDFIRKESGRKFDPEITGVFLEHISDIRRGYQTLENDLPYAVDPIKDETP
ncbi:MAG: response regulator [Candidatus Adiutrix sp.]|jgi:response regulator RpfG family c-di-GMP phosphodiesterase|nr:response regulator [Candidatus Adiutrix sp.]